MAKNNRMQKGAKDMSQAQTVKPFQGRVPDDNPKDFERWLSESVDEYIRTNTLERARQFLSRLSMYDENGNLKED